MLSDFSEQTTYLSILTAAPAAAVKDFVEALLVRLPQVEVLTSRTGLAMLPMQDSAQEATFHLGEVLLAEAHVRVDEQDGYAACLGRDLEQAIAIAILDALLQGHTPPALAEQPATQAFLARLAAQQASEEQTLLRKIEATRVELETF
ncbi:MAG: phosphonate C-P lyase system protein PhnG [Caldilineaceae bacterium]|nr:phosphonate C-P lyase system protein PhnG [Caldilineaceae bacterium]